MAVVLAESDETVRPRDVLDLRPGTDVHVTQVEGTHGRPYEQSGLVTGLLLEGAPPDRR